VRLSLFEHHSRDEELGIIPGGHEGIDGDGRLPEATAARQGEHAEWKSVMAWASPSLPLQAITISIRPPGIPVKCCIHIDEIFVAECQKSISKNFKTCWHVVVPEITVSFSESRDKSAGWERRALRPHPHRPGGNGHGAGS
jgi:hypothetical protein